MIVNLQIDMDNASKEELKFLAQTTTDNNVLTELIKKPYWEVVAFAIINDTTSAEKLDDLAKNLNALNIELDIISKWLIFLGILRNKNCRPDTIDYLFSLKEYEEVAFYDGGIWSPKLEYYLYSVINVFFKIIKTLVEDNKVQPETVIKFFRNMLFDDGGRTKVLEALKKWLPVEKFEKLPRFIEYALIGLAQNTKIDSYEIEVLLRYIRENILSKQLIFREGKKTEMFCAFASNEKTGKKVLNYLATIDDVRVRDAILKNPNASEDLKKMLNESRVPKG